MFHPANRILTVLFPSCCFQHLPELMCLPTRWEEGGHVPVCMFLTVYCVYVCKHVCLYVMTIYMCYNINNSYEVLTLINFTPICSTQRGCHRTLPFDWEAQPKRLALELLKDAALATETVPLLVKALLANSASKCALETFTLDNQAHMQGLQLVISMYPQVPFPYRYLPLSTDRRVHSQLLALEFSK